ncbi:hypothetical protein ACFX15_009718 [Malus domestica]
MSVSARRSKDALRYILDPVLPSQTYPQEVIQAAQEAVREASRSRSLAEQVEAAAQSSENAIQRILNPHQPHPSSIPPLLTSPTSPPSGSSPTLGQSSESELRLQLQILEIQEVSGMQPLGQPPSGRPPWG